MLDAPHPAGPYFNDDLAALYDLAHAGYREDIPMYAGLATEANGPVLELGVGTGRIALELARAGIDVTGIDVSAAMLSRLHDAITPDAASRFHPVEADMRDFTLHGQAFSLIYCALGTFEHLLTDDDATAALRCVARHLAPGGRFVCDLRCLGAVDWSGAPSRMERDWAVHDAATGETVTQSTSIVASQVAQTTTTTFHYDREARDGTRTETSFDVTARIFGPREFEALLARAGLVLHAAYGWYDLSPFDDAGDRMIVVAALP